MGGWGTIVAYTILHLASGVQIPSCGAYLQEQHQMTAILLTNWQFHLKLVRKSLPTHTSPYRLGSVMLPRYFLAFSSEHTPSFSKATGTPIQGRSFSETLDDDTNAYDNEEVLAAISSSNRLLHQP